MLAKTSQYREAFYGAEGKSLSVTDWVKEWNRFTVTKIVFLCVEKSEVKK